MLVKLVRQSSCRRPTSRPGRNTSRRSASRWRVAPTLTSYVTAPVGTSTANDCGLPTTSRYCRCHPTRPNATRWRTSGTTDAATKLSRRVWDSSAAILAARRDAWLFLVTDLERIGPGHASSNKPAGISGRYALESGPGEANKCHDHAVKGHPSLNALSSLCPSVEEDADILS